MARPFLILSPFMLSAVVILMPSSASAQHVCGAGPGPGEVLVGEQPGGNGISPTPLCDRVNSPIAQARRPSDPAFWGDPNAPSCLARGWSALVADNEKMAVSTVQGKQSRQEAIDVDMVKCKSKGGTNCRLVSAVDIR